MAASKHPGRGSRAGTREPAQRHDAKLTIKTGDKEVHLEARPDVVRQELGRVLERLFQGGDAKDDIVVSVTAPGPDARPSPASAPPPAAPADRTATALDFVARARGRQLIQAAVAKFLRHTALDPRTLAGLYSVDPEGKVALRTLPTTAQRLRDAFLLLLYGLLTLRGEWPVTGITLMRAARISGIELERVPRDFARDSELVTAFGRRRGKRYRLTLAGLRHCERLIPGMVADVGE